MSAQRPITSFRRCHYCGAPVRQCDKCGLEVELVEGAYGLVRVWGHPGVKVVCLDCFHGLADVKERADRGELTPEERALLERWKETS
jgi:hypothetical protein